MRKSWMSKRDERALVADTDCHWLAMLCCTLYGLGLVDCSSTCSSGHPLAVGWPHRPILFLSSWLRYLCLSCAISLALNGTLLSESGTRAKKNPFISYGLSLRPLLSFFSTYITSFSVTYESEFVGCIQQHKSPDTIRSNCMCRLQRVHLICLFPCQ